MDRYTIFINWETNIAKSLILPKMSYTFNAIPIKISVEFKLILKFI